MALSCKLVAAFAFLLSFAQVRGQDASGLGGVSASHPSQVLVFDAGSSGTRIHVFNILPGAKDSLVPRIDLSVRDRQTKKIKPGLSSFAENNDYAGAARNIEQLMEFANQWVPADRRSSTPALLKATAGLRAVKPAENAEATLEKVRETLAKSGYLFKPEWADVIKGKEEAGLAWVAANYLQGSLTNAPARASSLGVIEMGGGSTQVTFEVAPAEAPRVGEPDSFTFKTLAGRPYHLYAHSYLGYGQDHAQAKMRAMMLSTEKEDPCYPPEYQRPTVDDASIFVKGTGNAESCQELIKSRLLARGQSTAPGQYAGEFSLRGQFVATENFYYTRSDLKLPLDANIAAMKDAAKTACETPLNPSVELDAAMRAGTADPFKQKFCFGLSYQVALFEVLKTSTLPGVQVSIARNINGGDIDWALGAALMHFIDSGMASKAALEAEPTAMDTMPMRIGVFLVLVLFALGAARPFLGKSCEKPVAAVSSALRATTLGRGTKWIEVATKAPDAEAPSTE